jgi:hypothetical protein
MTFNGASVFKNFRGNYLSGWVYNDRLCVECRGLLLLRYINREGWCHVPLTAMTATACSLWVQ